MRRAPSRPPAASSSGSPNGAELKQGTRPAEQRGANEKRPRCKQPKEKFNAA